jgi:hypothetical protein
MGFYLGFDQYRKPKQDDSVQMIHLRIRISPLFKSAQLEQRSALPDIIKQECEGPLKPSTWHL